MKSVYNGLKSIKEYLINKVLGGVTAKSVEDILRLLPDFDEITLVDIGAAGDMPKRWKLIEQMIDYISFEPDERSRKLLLEKEFTCKNYTLLPNAIWHENGSEKLFFCKKAHVSSLYPPNHNFLKRFPSSNRFKVLKEITLNVSTLDSLSISKCDFMKIDIQGAELGALRGSSILLEETLGIEVEVEFLPMYQNQPLFGEVSEFLSNKDFEFIDFLNLNRSERVKNNSLFGQCLFGDALFLRSPEYLITNKFSSKKMATYICVCLLYNRIDLIDRILELQSIWSNDVFINFKKGLKNIKEQNLKMKRFHFFLNSLFLNRSFENKWHLLY